MLELPRDVQLLVLDNIKLKTDLKALCLTSRTLRDIAAPRLYNTIEINLRKYRAVSLFIRCMVAGGGLNLKNTRTLTLVDTHPPPEAHSVRPRDLDRIREEIRKIGDVAEELEAEVAKDIELIIDVLPNDCLHSFRFLSVRSLSWRMMEMLRTTQKKLSRVQVSCNDGLNKYALSDTLKSLDVWLPTPTSPVHTSETFGLHNQLERLCLAAAHDSGTYYSATLERLLSNPEAHFYKQNCLKVLTLHGLSLGTLHTPLTNIVSFSDLTHLTLWKCSDVHILLDSITRTSPSISPKLKLFALHVLAESQPFVDKPLDTLFRSCVVLESLCIQWDGTTRYRPTPLMANIERLGKTLISLSLHATLMEPWAEDALPYEEFKYICQSCPNLEQLGYHLGEADIAQMMGDVSVDMRNIFAPMQDLRHLKIVHLRQSFEEPYSRRLDRDDLEDASKAFKREEVARTFFEFMTSGANHGTVKAFVIGQENRLRDDAERREFHDYTPLHCYLRGELRDVSGRRRVTASPVTSHELRLTTDYADILDWHTGWEEPTKWMSRIPGRFNDD